MYYKNHKIHNYLLKFIFNIISFHGKILTSMTLGGLIWGKLSL